MAAEGGDEENGEGLEGWIGDAGVRMKVGTPCAGGGLCGTERCSVGGDEGGCSCFCCSGGVGGGVGSTQGRRMWGGGRCASKSKASAIGSVMHPSFSSGEGVGGNWACCDCWLFCMSSGSSSGMGIETKWQQTYARTVLVGRVVPGVSF